MDDARVHEALNELAREAPDAPSLWDRTQRRITHRRHRRTRLSAIAIVAILAIGAGTVVAVTRDTDDNRITAGPSTVADPPEEILGVIDGKLVVIDGSQKRDLVVPHATIAEVSTAPGASWIVYTSLDARTEPCAVGPALVKARPDGSQAQTIVGGGITRPLVSPDGAWVAYAKSECGGPTEVGVTNLDTGKNFLLPFPTINDDTNASWYPLAFTLGSSRLLSTDGHQGHALSSVPDGIDSELISFQPGVEHAAFTSDDELMISYPVDGGDWLGLYDLRTGEARALNGFGGPSGLRQITALSYDEASYTTLITVVDANGVGELHTSTRVPGETPISTGHGTVPGLLAATWFAPPASDEPATTIAPQPGSSDIIVPELRGLSIGGASAALVSIGMVPNVRQGTETVLWQEPPAGTTRRPGQTVSLWACWPGADCVPGPPPDYIDAFEPATDWRPFDLADDDWPALGSPTAASPEELGSVVAAFISDKSEGESVTYLATCAGCPTKELWVQTRNAPDDSADGWDYRFFLQQDANGAWSIDRGEQRVICARGENVTDACP